MGLPGLSCLSSCQFGGARGHTHPASSACRGGWILGLHRSEGACIGTPPLRSWQSGADLRCRDGAWHSRESPGGGVFVCIDHPASEHWVAPQRRLGDTSTDLRCCVPKKKKKKKNPLFLPPFKKKKKKKKK